MTTQTRTSNPPPSFPLTQAVISLTGVAWVGFMLMWWATSPVYTHTPGAEQAVFLAACVAWGTAIAGVIPVAWLGPLGVLPTVWGYFIGMSLRLTVCLGVYIYVSLHGQLPVYPMAVTLGVLYVPLLFTETAIVGRYLWNKDFLGRLPHQRVLGLPDGTEATA